MAAFQFKLDPVLRHRRIVEDERQRELARLLRERMILETQLRSTQESIGEDKRHMSGALSGRVDVERVRAHAAYAGQAAMQARQIAVKLVALHRQAEQARAALLDAARGRKAVERLREKQHRRWAERLRRRETAELDEMATQGYGRRTEESFA